MALENGTRLGGYTIVEPLGTGGMGEVYRARDAKLERDVAVKILPEELAHDGERLARFEREAKLLASINHPAIATLHGLEESEGTTFIVMELVAGETLAARLARGPLPVGDAIPLFVQIADALEAAHDKGVIHRDLKPANIMITPEERIKILDFGLAKAWQDEAPGGDSSLSPTLTRGTAMGAILGTAAYMSPEQARGKPVDRRTDLWAFGAVLYEALTGTRLFEGEDVSQTLAFVLTKDVDWSALPRATPASVRRLLRRTLERDRRRRLADAADARLELEDASARNDDTVASASQRFGWRWMAGVAVGALAAGLVAWLGVRPASVSSVARLSLVTPPSYPLYVDDDTDEAVAITPDGTRVIYFVSIEGGQGGQELRVRRLDAANASTLLTSTRHTLSDLFVSPDGEWVGFVDGSELKRISIRGGAAMTICSVPDGVVRGASWGDDDSIVFAVPRRGLFSVPASGGEAQVLLSREPRRDRYYQPHVLPGSRGLVFVMRAGPDTRASRIAVYSTISGTQAVVLESGVSPRYVSTGHLVYSLEGQLQAIPFDLDRLEVTGGPRALNDQAQSFAISRNGVLVYLPTTFRGFFNRTLAWVDLAGRKELLHHPPDGYYDVALSPDGGTLAIDMISTDGGSVRDVWTYDVERGARTRLTFDGGAHPVWTPDGRRVTFFMPGEEGIYWRSADGSRDAELLVSDALMPNSWSPDGTVLAFTRAGEQETGTDIWVLPVGDEPAPLLQSVHNEEGPMFSPDGHFLAYVSDESGVEEIYVQPYPGPGGKVPISVGGGRAPVWSPDGSKIYYRSWSPKRVEVVSIDTDAGIAPGVPTTAFADPYFAVGPGDPHYDVSRDGERLLMIDVGADTREGRANQITVVLNWFQELERLVPTN